MSVVRKTIRLQFQAAFRLNLEEKDVIRAVIESIVVRNIFKAANAALATAEEDGTNE